MSDPLLERDQALAALLQVFESAGPYLDSLDDRLVYDVSKEHLLKTLEEPLPDEGIGTSPAVRRLVEVGTETSTASSGPRFFHFVIGGSTPAAMAADWLVTLLDQNAAARASSMFAHTVETVAIDWLRDLVGLPVGWGGALTASATFANFTGLGCATHWWAERHRVDSTEMGLAGLPRLPVLSSGLIHPSSRKALQMLGHGRGTVEIYQEDRYGRADIRAMSRRLSELAEPAVVIATVGEPNAGASDPVSEIADVVAQHDAWLHIDGAFGVFAAVSPATASITEGLHRADSVAGDAHKWLNVPYESGFVLLAEPGRLGTAFGMPGAPYLPGPEDPRSGYMLFGPESSRRARAVPIWATLVAYGRNGIREMVERHCELARYMAQLVDHAPDLERLADVPLNVVCFRYHPRDMPIEGLNDLNRRIGEMLLEDGRVFAGTTSYGGDVALRPAISNWRTTAEDVELFVDVVTELGRLVTVEGTW